MVLDEKNTLKVWLAEQIEKRKLTVPQADQHLKDYETQAKNWVGPFKDVAGTGKLAVRLARDINCWKGVRVTFREGKDGTLVIIKGWPHGRKLLPGTRYRVDNPKIMELQIGKPGLRAAARESARFGVIFVVAVDVADYFLRDKATLGELLGALTVDIPSVVLASAIGAAAGSWAASTTIAGLAVIGTFAIGPALVALAVGVVVGYGLYLLDDHFHFGEKLGRAYDRGLEKLRQVWEALSLEAAQRFSEFERSDFVQDMTSEVDRIASTLGRESNLLRVRLSKGW